MPEASAARDRHPLARFGFGHLDALIRGDTRTDERCRLGGREAIRNVRDVRRVGENVLGKAAILCVAAELRVRAHRLPRLQTILAMAAGRVEPRHTHAIAILHQRHACAHLGHAANRLMPRDERQRWLQGPVTGGGMQVRMTHAAGLGLHDDLTRAHRWHSPLAQNQRLAKLFHHRCLHGGRALAR